eukprot:c15022_g1_i1 orf=2-241(+)
MAQLQVNGRVAMANLLTLLVLVVFSVMNGNKVMAQSSSPAPSPVSGAEEPSSGAMASPMAFATMTLLSLLVGALLSKSF